MALVDATTPANSTLNALDNVNGGLGGNSLTLNMVGAAVLPGGISISNVGTINARGSAAVALDLTTAAGITGVTALNSTFSAAATLKAADTTDIGVSGATGAIAVEGGKNVTVTDAGTNNAITIGATTVNKGTITVTDTKVGTAAIDIDGGTDVTVTATGSAGTGAINIGQGGAPTDLASGAVVVSSTGATYVAASSPTLHAINIDGGKTISVTQKATADASAIAADKAAGTVTQGDVTIVAAATTTTVSVKQDADVGTAVNATDKTGGVTSTTNIKFGVLKSGDVLAVAGLTLKASADMSATEVAAAFAGLVNNAAFAAPATILAGDTQAGGVKGVYTLVSAGWTSAAAAGDSVVFTSTTPNSAAALIVPVLTNTSTTSVTPVVTGTVGKANDAGATGGALKVVTGVVDITGGAALATVTVDGYGAAAANQVQGASNTALATVNLSNGGNFTVASAAATLALNLTNVNGTVAVTAGTTALNTAVNGAGTATLTSGSATSVKVAGAGNVAGVAGAGLAVATAIDTTAMTAGSATFTLDSTAVTYAGGAGADKVTFSNATAATKALDLGAGNDTLVFAAASAVPTAVLKGGAGDDTVSLVAANAVTLSGSTAFASQLDSFERLEVTGATGAQAIDLGKLGFTNYVTVAGGAGTLTLTDLANNATVALTANGGAVVALVKDAATGMADVLNVRVDNVTGAGSIAAGTLTAADVETVNITVADGDNTGPDSHSLTLDANKATTVTIVNADAGDKTNLALTLTNSTKVTSIDGSAMTGNLTVTSFNTTAATTIKGGSGNDVLTAAVGTTADVLLGGDGNDVLVSNAGLSTLTGGAGNDVFHIGTASLNVNSYTTITDFAAGDLLQIVGASSFAASKVVLGGTAVFQDYANAITAGTVVGAVSWFQLDGDTYLIEDNGAGVASFNNGVDFVVKLSGLVDLSNATFNDTYNTIALA